MLLHLNHVCLWYSLDQITSLIVNDYKPINIHWPKNEVQEREEIDWNVSIGNITVWIEIFRIFSFLSFKGRL